MAGGPIQLILMALAGAGGPVADEILVSGGDSDVGIIVKGVGTAGAGINLETDGDLRLTSSGGNRTGEWLVSGVAADWSVYATLTSGTTPTINSGLGSWLALTTERSWANSRIEPSDGVGVTTSTLTLDFSDDGGSTTKYTFTGIIIAAELS